MACCNKKTALYFSIFLEQSILGGGKLWIRPAFCGLNNCRSRSRPILNMPSMNFSRHGSVTKKLNLDCYLDEVQAAARSVSEENDAWVRRYYVQYGWRKNDDD